MNKRSVVGEWSVSQDIGLSAITLTREYDLHLVGLSWERRASACFGAVENRPGDLIALRFASMSDEVDRRKDEHKKNLLDLGLNLSELNLEKSTNFRDNASKIELLIQDAVAERGRPLRILLDMTCLPKSYILFLVGLSFKTGLVSRLDCMYAEGSYALGKDDEGDVPTLARGIISEGDWATLQVPYLEASSAIPRSQDIFVTMGGEIGLTLPFLTKFEPKRVGLALIKESLAQDPDKLIPTERFALEELLAQPNLFRHDVLLSDVVTVSDRLIQFSRESEAEIVSALALGSKPHALALGLCALSSENIQAICRIPKAYKLLDVPPSGVFAFYQIDDRFEPSGYF